MSNNTTKTSQKTRIRPVPTQTLNAKGKHKVIDVEVEVDKNGKQKTKLMYVRKSTKKDTQEESIATQNRRVLKYLKNLGIDENEVIVFSDEGISGFKDIHTNNGRVISRPRDGFSDMMRAIDNSKEPCTIYSYSVSRLGRNLSEGMLIIEKLGIGHKQIQKIKEVHICGIDKQIWTSKTKKTHIQECFNDVEADSELKSDYMYENIEENLERFIYPPMLPTPHGLTATSEGLEETEEMKFIVHAMQMRIDGKGLEAIRQYLADSGIEYDNERSITNSLFKNTLYTGLFIPKKGKLKGNVYGGLTFTSGKPPITQVFFDSLQERVGKKAGGYGAQQDEGDIISQLLKWETDKSKVFSREIKKGKYLSYRNSDFSSSELKIVRQFISEVIPKVVRLYYEVQKNTKLDTREKFYSENDMVCEDAVTEEMIIQHKKKNTELTSIEKSKLNVLDSRENELRTSMLLLEIGSDISTLEEVDSIQRLSVAYELHQKSHIDELTRTINRSTKAYKILQKQVQQVDNERDAILSLYSKETLDLGRKESELSNILEKTIKEYLTTFFSHSSSIERASLKKKESAKQTKILEKEKEQKLTEKDGIPDYYADLGYHKDVADRKMEKIDNEIKLIEEKLGKLLEVLETEDFLDKLPEVLIKIFELSSRVLREKDIKTVRGDIYRLLEITTFELSVTTKKELKIKLFDGIKTLEDAFLLNGAPDKNRTCV